MEYSSAEAQSFVEWDVATWSRAIPVWEKHFPRGDRLEGLELGGRRGGLSLYMATHGIEVLCSDVENPESIALPLHERSPVGRLISYGAVDALNIPFENRFDVLMFKSIVGGIGRIDGAASQRRVFEQAYKALKPGGVLLFAENLEGCVFHRFLRKHFVPWGQSWLYPTLADLRAWLGIFSDVHLHTTGFLSAVGPSETWRSALARLDAMLLPVVPATSRYVAFGAARKPR